MQREHSGDLPPNMESDLPITAEVGELNWAARPAMNVSTKDIDPLGVASGNVQRQAEQPVPATSSDPPPSRTPVKLNRRRTSLVRNNSWSARFRFQLRCRKRAG